MRRLQLKDKLGKRETSLVMVDETLEDPYKLGLKYYFKIIISGGTYYYLSEYPFYALKDENGSLRILYAQGKTQRRKNTSIGGGYYGTKNGIKYNIESYTRNAAVAATIVSNYPIEEWKE